MEVKLNHVTYIENKKKLIDDISYTFSSSCVSSIIGPSGSGKTLLTKLIMGFEKVSDGEIEIGKYNLNKEYKDKNLRDFYFQVGYVFQNCVVEFFESTVYKELEFNLKKYNYRLSKKDKQIKDSIKIVGLSENVLNQSPFDLSYGEKTKLALALMLSLNPKVLILDEPTIGLDNKNKNFLIRLLKKIALRYHKTIIIVSNDIDFILKVSENLLVINNGKKIIDGKVKEVLKENYLLRENNIELPAIIDFINLVYEKKNIKLDYTLEVKDLIKDIYRNATK